MTKSPRNEFEKLSDQDPSAGIEFDQAALIANLKQRLPEASLSDSFPLAESKDTEVAVSPDTHQIDHPTVVPLRRKGAPAWGQIAASVAVTALLAGGGVYAATAADNGNTDLADSPSIMASSAPNTEQLEQNSPANTQGGKGLALGSPQDIRTEGLQSANSQMPNVNGSRDMAQSAVDGASDQAKTMPWGYSGRYSYTAQGLSTQETTAAAYGFDESAVVTKETFEKLKKALGVDGETRSEWGSFNATAADNTSLGMNGNGLGSMWFYSEKKVEKGESDAAVAVERVRTLMTELGVDPAQYTFEAKNDVYYTWNATTEDMARESTSTTEPAQQGTEHQVTNVTAQLKELKSVQYSADTWSLTMYNDQIISMNGSLASLVNLGDYPVISPTKAVERLSDPRFGTTNVAWPADGPAYIDVAPTGPGEKDGPKASKKPTAGMSFTWEVSNQVITKAELGLSGFTQPDGTYTMLPAWNLSSKQGLTFTVMAVADSKLDF